ncbi:MAG: hypothetical protein JNL43_15105 [Flavobacteriales bacterium]|nr:hypothetical protein [Flavobacteriales bacterium]
MRVALILSGALLVTSCSTKTDSRAPEQLRGTWILDSATTPSGLVRSYHDQDEPYSERFTFLNDSIYEREWWHGDVGNTYQGRYFILHNPDRGARTFAGIPDLSPRDRDSVRMAYDVFDVLSLEDSLMVTILETRFIEKDSGAWPAFSEQRYYSRER